MRRAVRFLRYFGLSLVGLVLLALAIVYAVSEGKLRRKYVVTSHPISIPQDSASIADGGRFARIRGCTDCHGSMAEGKIFVDHWLVGRVVAPNLTKAVRQYSDPDIIKIIRQGVRPDGRSAIGMPSGMFFALSDHDLGVILAYLRSLPVQEGHTREVRLGLAARVLLATGRFMPAAAEAQRAAEAATGYPAPNDSQWTGAYLARSACTECHGLDLRGDASAGRPDLKIAGLYPREAFVHLLRTGKALGEREVGLMSSVARERFRHFTNGEIAALHDYLVARTRQ